jgi:hypothetical protein
MNDLLNVAMKAHGGLERWKQVRNMQAKVTLNGTLWRIKGRPDGLSGVVMRLNTNEPDLTITPFPKPGTAGHFTPSRVWIEDANGTVVSELKNPRDSFAGAVLTTKWNELQELYFASYAFWNYFTVPFLLAQPGVEVEEIETHNEDGETWRQLIPLARLFISMTRVFFRGLTMPPTWRAAWLLTTALTMSLSTVS